MKQKKLSRISLAAVALAVIAPAFATESRIGEVVQRQYNGAMAEPNGRTASHAIHFSDSVFALDTVRTDATGTTALQFLDDTTVQLGSNAEVRLDSFAYDPSTTVGAGELSFTKGAFRYIGGKMSTEENVRLHTPTATMVIRGTELVIYVWDDGRTEVNVVSGAVAVSGCGGKGSSLAMTGMQVTVLPNCSTHMAAAPKLPEGFDALTMPERRAGTTDEGGDEDSDRGAHRGKDPNAGGRKDPPSHEPPANGGSNGG